LGLKLMNVATTFAPYETLFQYFKFRMARLPGEFAH